MQQKLLNGALTFIRHKTQKQFKGFRKVEQMIEKTTKEQMCLALKRYLNLMEKSYRLNKNNTDLLDNKTPADYSFSKTFE